MRKLMFVTLIFVAFPGFAQQAFNGSGASKYRAASFKATTDSRSRMGFGTATHVLPQAIPADDKPHKASSPYYDTATMRKIGAQTGVTGK